MSQITWAHVNFATYFVDNCYKQLRYDDKIRTVAKNIYDDYAKRRQGILGIRQALISICGYCDFEDDVLKTFRPAIRKHLDGIFVRRETLSEADKKMLMQKHGMICPSCGKPIIKANFDHILPFFIVFDTLELDNRQCLCEECNRAKGTRIVAKLCA